MKQYGRDKRRKEEVEGSKYKRNGAPVNGKAIPLQAWTGP
jgi:hypothetical protein